MKRLGAIVIAASLLLAGSPAFAFSSTEVEKIEVISAPVEDENSSAFFQFSGSISELRVVDGNVSFVAKSVDGEIEMVFPISDEALLVNSTTTEVISPDALKEGTHVDVYYDKNRPIPMIYPAVVTPDIVIVNEGMGSVKVSKFDEQLLSLDNYLQLHLAKETLLVNGTGEKISEHDLMGKELVVFYTISTKSLPAQTTPEKIIAIDKSNEENELFSQLSNEDYYLKNGTKMLPLRLIAEQLGYNVEWQKETKTVLLSKDGQSLQLAIGQEQYNVNRSNKQFEVSPEIIAGRTYVPEEFFLPLN